MILKEEQRDLFSVPHGYYFAHCISGDFALGAGIAVQFNELYNMREKLKKGYPNFYLDECGALLIDNVFNLVTKKKGYYKPTYEDFRTALEDMAFLVDDLEIEKIAMPKIGCGLDRLDWETVKEIIEDVFKDIDVEILVCYL
jgi:O-acetyl-ADP-ribose deacetylase (regulator of RNase III)